MHSLEFSPQFIRKFLQLKQRGSAAEPEAGSDFFPDTGAEIFQIN